MAHEFDVIVERDSEGYYVASVPALPCCHTQAKSLDGTHGTHQGSHPAFPGGGRQKLG